VKKTLFLLAWALLQAVVPRAQADDSGFFPPAHDVFKPLLADPRELQYAVRTVNRVSHKLLGEAAIGDYWGIYRVGSPNDGFSFQVSGGGGFFGRFKLAAAANDMQVADFYANLPFDFRSGPWSGRFMLYHTSSHLGDDYLQKTGATSTKHTWDNLRWIGSYEPTTHLRLYGGYTYAFRELPGHLGRSAFQGGVETVSGWWAGGHVQGYWANDFQAWQRTDWNPMLTSQLGIKLAKDPKTKRAISLFMEFMAGRQPHGQFFRQKETRWNFGVKFHLT
jgi:hypothetical protein